VHTEAGPVCTNMHLELFLHLPWACVAQTFGLPRALGTAAPVGIVDRRDA
jgi:hypothetical protein